MNYNGNLFKISMFAGPGLKCLRVGFGGELLPTLIRALKKPGHLNRHKSSSVLAWAKLQTFRLNSIELINFLVVSQQSHIKENVFLTISDPIKDFERTFF